MRLFKKGNSIKWWFLLGTIIGVPVAVAIGISAVFLFSSIQSDDSITGGCDDPGVTQAPISEIGENEIPQEYIPIYHAAGEKYNVPWNLLAAHHRVETRFSTIKNMISPVGATGHMQFMVCTWVGWNYPGCGGLGIAPIPPSYLTSIAVIAKYGGYGVDANNDGKADPNNLEDAVYAAAKYDAANGASTGDLAGAVYAYNHSAAYVQEVLMYASLYASGNAVVVGGKVTYLPGNCIPPTYAGGEAKSPTEIGPGAGFGGMMLYVEAAYNDVIAHFSPTTFMGAYNNRNVRGGSTKSMHAYGRAFDIGGSPEIMSKIAEYARKLPYVQYVIYNHRITAKGGGEWKPYHGVNPHTDHVHIDFVAVFGTNNTTTPTGTNANAVIAEAQKYLGVPYLWGGTSPSTGFDCSGLMLYSFRSIGIELPRTAAAQQLFGTSISPTEVKPGDLVFQGVPAYHVGMYIGNGKWIAAPQTGGVVNISNYDASKFSTATRVLQ
jgi:cell wall-associated NlpC family hydrolase